MRGMMDMAESNDNNKIDIVQKLSSRKLWMCIVAFFGSIATSIASLNSGYEFVAGIGITAGIIAAAASAVTYVLTEGAIDRARINVNSVQTINQNTVTATTEDRATVSRVLSPAQDGQEHHAE